MTLQELADYDPSFPSWQGDSCHKGWLVRSAALQRKGQSPAATELVCSPPWVHAEIVTRNQCRCAGASCNGAFHGWLLLSRGVNHFGGRGW